MNGDVLAEHCIQVSWSCAALSDQDPDSNLGEALSHSAPHLGAQGTACSKRLPHLDASLVWATLPVLLSLAHVSLAPLGVHTLPEALT